MKQLFLISCFCVVLIGFGSCLKNNSDNTPAVDCTTVSVTAPSSEVFPLKTYLDTNHITAVQDSRGFFYTMDSTAALDMDANHARVCSSVTVTYRGYFENGKGFDSSVSSLALPLANTITGWQEALPLMKKGATMTLYLPPSLAYGATGSGGSPQLIAPNTPLIFIIKLYDFQ